MVTVLYFAAARELVGVSTESLALSEPCSIESFANVLMGVHPSLVPYLTRIKLALNGEYVAPGTVVHDGDEIAVIPPVAGG